MRCSYLVHVLVDVAAGDGGVGDKVKELSDRHHRHTVLHKEVWMEAQDVILKFRGGGTRRDTKAQNLTSLYCFTKGDGSEPLKLLTTRLRNSFIPQRVVKSISPTTATNSQWPTAVAHSVFFVIYCPEFILLCILF